METSGESGWRPATSALLWDLDNVAPGYAHLATLAAVLSGLTESNAPRVAAGHRATYRVCQPLLDRVGFEVLNGGRGANGADRALSLRAEALRRSGVERFIVASNDGAFARLARLGDLYVVTLEGAPVSRKLRDAARSLRFLRRDQAGWLLMGDDLWVGGDGELPG